MTTQEQKEERKPVCCPFCDSEIREADFPFCQTCRVTVLCCPQCQQPVPRDKTVCPHCGAKIQG